MQVEFADDLKPMLEEGQDLQIQGSFFPEKDILGRYLNRGYGNAYDFDQQDRLEEENWEASCIWYCLLTVRSRNVRIFVAYAVSAIN